MECDSYRAQLSLEKYRVLLIAQFAGAFNDNLCRMVASLFAVSIVGLGAVSMPREMASGNDRHRVAELAKARGAIVA